MKIDMGTEARPGAEDDRSTSVLIVDDEVAERELLATILGHADYLAVTADTGEHALRLARAQQPGLIIADILMPTMDGYELVRELRRDPDTAHIPVVFYTATYVIDEVRELADACGVADVLVKPYEPDDVLRIAADALARPSGGVAQLPSEAFHREHLRMLNAKLIQKVEELRETVILACALRRESVSPPERSWDVGADARIETLSPREREVLGMIVDGASNGDIAASLAIAPSTVQSHIKRIFHKLGVKNRTEAAVRYIRR
ncbi:MAG: two-component system, cell cycle sensor histidine kinase and response regulator CckA [Solirubrobacteraceae bacterium]|jgi:DNA-binding NarL/FixJ family response regulator|nr:two-component system, cell cycle sensor histidine kinase and response regulator CckA [Solirubrobacteraceae bacterium]